MVLHVFYHSGRRLVLLLCPTIIDSGFLEFLPSLLGKQESLFTVVRSDPTMV